MSILSVVYRDAGFWRRNRALTARLNPSAHCRWIVVDNSPTPILDETAGEDLDVLPGAAVQGIRDRGSLHHALALEKALAHARTRFVLLLDHDFYMLRPGWIATLLDHMLANDVAIFGAVWNPRWFYQYQGFPSVHFMLVDTARIAPDSLPLRPLIDGDWWWNLINDERIPLPALVRDTLKARRIRDIGWQIFDRYAHDYSIRVETLCPHFTRPRQGRAAWEEKLAPLLPRAVLKYPRPGEGYTEASILRALCPPAYDRGWEEFFWQHAPLAVHLRRVGRAMMGDETADDDALLDEVLDQVAGIVSPETAA